MKSIIHLLYTIKTTAASIWFIQAAKKIGSDGVPPS